MPYDHNEHLPEDIFAELVRLAEFYRNPELQSVRLAQLNVEPDRYEDGMIVYADGTNFDPNGGGLGEGVYCYYGGQWNKL